MPGRGVANVSSFAYLVGNPRRKRLEAATAHTAERLRDSHIGVLITFYVISREHHIDVSLTFPHHCINTFPHFHIIL